MDFNQKCFDLMNDLQRKFLAELSEEGRENFENFLALHDANIQICYGDEPDEERIAKMFR